MSSTFCWYVIEYCFKTTLSFVYLMHQREQKQLRSRKKTVDRVDTGIWFFLGTKYETHQPERDFGWMGFRFGICRKLDVISMTHRVQLSLDLYGGIGKWIIWKEGKISGKLLNIYAEAIRFS